MRALPPYGQQGAPQRPSLLLAIFHMAPSRRHGRGLHRRRARERSGAAWAHIIQWRGPMIHTTPIPCDVATALQVKLERNLSPESTGCILWTGKNQAHGGYGRIKFRGKAYAAHRVAWAYAHGDPGRNCVLHSCDTPACCNTEHMFLGTRDDNNKDKTKKGRGRCGTGENQGLSKLTNAAVTEARVLHAKGTSTRKMAEKYGVHENTLYKAIHRLSWRHVP